MSESEFGVTPDDIRVAAFGLEVPEDEHIDAQLARLIAKAEARLLVLIPGIPARVQRGTLSPSVVKGVIEDMVLRVVKNPRSLRSMGIDDFQATVDTAVSTGLLYVTEEERHMLRPRGRRSHRSRNVGLRVPPWRLPRA